MTTPAVPGEVLPPQPPALALALGLDLVTRYRLRLTDPRDGRLGALGGDAYLLGAAAWTGRRAAFAGFYQPPADADSAARDLEARVRAAEVWANERLGAQGAERCDVLLVALGPVPRPTSWRPAGLGGVQVGAVSVDTGTADVQVLLPTPGGLPGAGEIRAHARAILQGRPVPTLAAVDLAERQTVAGGYAQPARRALSTQPTVTLGLLAVFVAIWLVELNLKRIPNPSARILAMGALANSGPAAGDWWRYVSSAFLHDPGSPLHILFNGFAMFYIGRIVEQLYGRTMLLGVFLVTAAGGGLFWVGCADLGIASQSPVPGIGASGGIMGLIGLLAVLGRIQGRDVPVGVVASLRQYAITFVVLTIVIGLFVPGTNNYAHIGGFLTGVVLGLALPPQRAVGGRDLHVWERVVLGGAVLAGVVALGLAANNTIDALNAVPQQIFFG